jgi:hypothetical protein
MESKGMSLNVVLTIVFVVLRLCEVITWSWVWVFSPLWISWSITILFVIVFALFFPEAFRKWWKKL